MRKWWWIFGACLALGHWGCAEMLQGPDGVRRTQAAVVAAGAAADVAKEKAPDDPEGDRDEDGEPADEH